jgi:PPOX class probable F420-dependent enzyme
VDLVDLGTEPYVSLTTFKRDGSPISTPVWVARDDGRLLVHSAAESWKVKRIRRDGHVRVTACGFNGKTRGDTFDGFATIDADTARVQELEARKYGLMYRVIRGLTALNRWLRRKPAVESVAIAIAPVAGVARQVERGREPDRGAQTLVGSRDRIMLLAAPIAIAGALR